jgi:hypothetical protein
MEILRDTEDSPEPEYFPATLLSQPTTMLSPVYPTGPTQLMSGAGAVNVTSALTRFTSTGVDDALTLADGTVLGQVKTVTHVGDGGSGVLTPTNFAEGTSLTFTGPAETWTGQWTGTTWQTIGLSGGAAVPALT